jgi:hypothetical protein
MFIKAIVRSLTILSVLTVFALPQVAGATPAYTMVADAKSDVCAGIGAASGQSGCTASGPSVNRILTFTINILSVVAGIAAVIMIIIAGLKYITSNGEAGNINSAKTSLIYAIVGLVIVAISQFLVQYVIAKVR